MRRFFLSKPVEDPRRKAILQAAGTILTRDGYHALTTAAVAREAKMSKRAIYACFDTKDALMAALVGHSTSTMTAPLQLAAPEDLAALYAGLSRFGFDFLTFVLNPDRIALYRVAIAEADRDGTLGPVLIEQGLSGMLNGIVAFFIAATQRGLVSRSDCEMLPGLFMAMLIGGTQMRLLLGAVDNTGPDMVQERVERAVALVRRLIEG
jgi:AcrR family transcriptional regulator